MNKAWSRPNYKGTVDDEQEECAGTKQGLFGGKIRNREKRTEYEQMREGRPGGVEEALARIQGEIEPAAKQSVGQETEEHARKVAADLLAAQQQWRQARRQDRAEDDGHDAR